MNLRARRWLGISILYALLCMVVLAYARGAWLDELWTLWMTDTALPVGQLSAERWSFDAHPPLFYSWIWTVRHLIGDYIPSLRMTNLVGVGLLAGAAGLARRYGASRNMLAIFLLLTLSSPVVIVYFSEMRAYFLETTLFAGEVLLLQRVHFARSDVAWRRDGALLGGLGVLMLLASNLHYLAGGFCFTAAGVEMLNQLRRRHFRYAAAILLMLAVSIGCLAIPLLHYVSLEPGASPMNVSSIKGYQTMAGVIAIAAAANLAALWFATRSLLASWRAARPAGAGAAGGIGQANALTYLAVSALTLAIVAVAFTSLNLLTHLLIPRYILQIVPLVAGPLAYLARRQVGRAWFVAVPVNAALLSTAAVAAQVRNARWEYNVPKIRAIVAECPTTRVLGFNPFWLSDQTMLPKASGSPQQTLANIIDSGYAYLGRQNDFDVTFVPGPAPITTMGSCPTLIWVESNYWRPNLTADELLSKAKVQVDPGWIGRSDMQRQGDHALLMLYPHAKMDRK